MFLPVQLLSDVNFVGWGILLCVVGVFVGIFVSAGAIRRKLRNSPLREINSVADGEVVKIAGEVICLRKSLIAPASGRNCAYYSIIVSERNVTFSRTGGSTRTVIEETNPDQIFLKNGNDYVVIDTKGAKTFLTAEGRYKSNLWNPPTEQMRSYLKHFELPDSSIFRYRYREYLLEEGQWISAWGKAHWKKPEEFHLKISSKRILAITPDKYDPVYFSDDPGLAK